MLKRLLKTAAGILMLSGCFGPGNLDPADLSEAERAVRVYYQGQQPPCPYDQLGIVEGESGTSVSMGTFQSTLAKMQRETARRGGNGVIVMDHTKNGVLDQATGMAIRCR
jgi:hypothetical protein